jgi:hypothetical protein
MMKFRPTATSSRLNFPFAPKPWTGLLLLLALAAACGPLVNDGSKRRPVAPQASYQTSRPAGESAKDLLSGALFKSVVVEVQAIRSFGPTPEALNRFKRFLEERLDKPGGVTISATEDLPASAASASYTISEARSLESKYRNKLPAQDQLAIYYLFLDGSSADATASGSKLLGQAYGNSSVVIFENTLRTESTARTESPARAAVPIWFAEAAVMEHEFGHLLGLVGTPTQSQSVHEDPANPGHCGDKSCLMHASGDTTDLLDRLAVAGATAPELDAACLKDLKAAGGK